MSVNIMKKSVMIVFIFGILLVVGCTNANFSPRSGESEENIFEIMLNSPLNGEVYKNSEILIDISAISVNDIRCKGYQCENYYTENNCLNDAEEYNGCFWEAECDGDGNCWNYEEQEECELNNCEWIQECDTYDCWDLENENECENNNYGLNCIWNDYYCIHNESTCYDLYDQTSCEDSNLSCIWIEDGGNYCDVRECKHIAEEVYCEDNIYELDCFWDDGRIDDIWYNVNGGENIDYINSLFYIFRNGENSINACANFYDVETICDSTVFTVNKPIKIFPNFMIFPIPE